MLLGEALVPLQPLLTQPWIDGYAPVAEIGRTGAKTGSQLGAVRIVVAVEEVGVVSSDEGQGQQGGALRSAESSQAQLSDFKTSADVRAGSVSRPGRHASDTEESAEEGRTAQRALFGKEYLRQIEDDIQRASEGTARDLMESKRAVAAMASPAKPSAPSSPGLQARPLDVEQITQRTERLSLGVRGVEKRRGGQVAGRDEGEGDHEAGHIQKEWKRREKERLTISAAQNEAWNSPGVKGRRPWSRWEEREEAHITARGGPGKEAERRRWTGQPRMRPSSLRPPSSVERRTWPRCKLDILHHEARPVRRGPAGRPPSPAAADPGEL